MNVVTLVLDRLHAGYVGAYGNSWIDTPAFNHLAAESFVADQYLIDTPRLDLLYRAFWQGQHALAPAGANGPSLARLAHERGLRSLFLSDETSLLRTTLPADFDRVYALDPPRDARVADEIDETHLARSFTGVIKHFESAVEPFFLWCHLAGLGTVWDAPLEFRERYADEEDPPPLETADVPYRLLEADFDPDELVGQTQAYAGQVALLDVCLGAFLEAFESHPARDETLLVVAGARGFPLGEHRRLGGYDAALYSELVHVPLMIRLPAGAAAGGRSQAFVHPADLWASILDWWNIPTPPNAPAARSLLPLARDEIDEVRDRLCLTDGNGGRAIRTPAWYLREGDTAELYVKPDDRWDANDVSNRCANVIEPLRAAWEEYCRAIAGGDASAITALADVLREGLG